MTGERDEVTEGELWQVLTEILQQASGPSERVWWLIMAVRAVDEEFLSPKKPLQETERSRVPRLSDEAEETLQKVCKPIELLQESQARLGEAAKAQSEFLDQQISINRAFSQFCQEVDQWPEDEKPQILEGARRNLEREREIMEGMQRALESPDPDSVFDVIADIRHGPRDKKASAMQALVDEACSIRDAPTMRWFIDGMRRALESPDVGDMEGILADLRHSLQTVKVSSMQERVDEARSSSDGTRTREELEAEGLTKSDPEDRHQATLDAIARADRGETVSQDEVERVLSTPMRIQNLLRDAQPQEWEIMEGGGFVAEPVEGDALEVSYQRIGWVWRVACGDYHGGGTAPDPAHAVAIAETVYWLATMRTPE